METEYITGQINSRMLERLLRRFLHRLKNYNMLYSDDKAFSQ